MRQLRWKPHQAHLEHALRLTVHPALRDRAVVMAVDHAAVAHRARFLLSSLISALSASCCKALPLQMHPVQGVVVAVLVVGSAVDLVVSAVERSIWSSNM